MGKSFRETIDERMTDPEFKAEWDALEPEFQMIHSMRSKIRDTYHTVCPGWWRLLDKYLSQIWTMDPACEVIVKEKFGCLRIWPYRVGDGVLRNDVWEICKEAEKESETVCEICGNPGRLRTDQEWWQTLCDQCAAMEEKERNEVERMVSKMLLSDQE